MKQPETSQNIHKIVCLTFILAPTTEVIHEHSLIKFVICMPGIEPGVTRSEVDHETRQTLTRLHLLPLSNIIEASVLSHLALPLKGVYIRKGKFHSVWL